MKLLNDVADRGNQNADRAEALFDRGELYSYITVYLYQKLVEPEIQYAPDLNEILKSTSKEPSASGSVIQGQMSGTYWKKGLTNNRGQSDWYEVKSIDSGIAFGERDSFTFSRILSQESGSGVKLIGTSTIITVQDEAQSVAEGTQSAATTTTVAKTTAVVDPEKTESREYISPIGEKNYYLQWRKNTKGIFEWHYTTTAPTTIFNVKIPDFIRGWKPIISLPDTSKLAPLKDKSFAKGVEAIRDIMAGTSTASSAGTTTEEETLQQQGNQNDETTTNEGTTTLLINPNSQVTFTLSAGDGSAVTKYRFDNAAKKWYWLSESAKGWAIAQDLTGYKDAVNTIVKFYFLGSDDTLRVEVAGTSMSKAWTGAQDKNTVVQEIFAFTLKP